MDNPIKYRVLRAIALLCMAVACLVLLAGVVAAIAFLASGPGTVGVWIGNANWTGLVLLPFAVYCFLQLLVVGAFLLLLIDMDRNTRANIRAIEGIDRLAAAANAAKPHTTTPS